VIGGCTTEPLPFVCPNVEVGELVISELRGDQADSSDSFGHYVEVYNAAGKQVDLQGLRVRLRSTAGDELEVFVRESIELEAGGHAVIGPGLPDEHASWIDYAIGWDISGGNPEDDSPPTDFVRYAGAFVELEACGELIDETFYDLGELPETGTLACGNASNPPDAAANDERDSPCWCVDDQPDPTLFGVGLPGSPGSANRCP
jgi:hypothetical protein